LAGAEPVPAEGSPGRGRLVVHTGSAPQPLSNTYYMPRLPTQRDFDVPLPDNLEDMLYKLAEGGTVNLIVSSPQ